MMPLKTIEAVIEIEPFEGEAPWVIAPLESWSFLRLYSGITDEEIGAVMLTACGYNHHVEIQPSAIETLEAFISEDFVMPGGLRFSENGEVKVRPGCCAGLEDWREWLDVPSGSHVWAGHDPTPGVEFVDGIIRIWQDVKAEGVSFIDFDADEMRSLLEQVETDLQNFLFRLGQWASFISPALQEKIVAHFARNWHTQP